MSIILMSVAMIFLGITDILQTSMIRESRKRIDELESEIRNAKVEMLEMRSKAYAKFGDLEYQINKLECQIKGE